MAAKLAERLEDGATRRQARLAGRWRRVLGRLRYGAVARSDDCESRADDGGGDRNWLINSHVGRNLQNCRRGELKAEPRRQGVT